MRARVGVAHGERWSKTTTAPRFTPVPEPSVQYGASHWGVRQFFPKEILHLIPRCEVSRILRPYPYPYAHESMGFLQSSSAGRNFFIFYISGMLYIMSLFRAYIPKSIISAYHWCIAWLAGIVYGFPSHGMKVIGVTGTKGKSTTCFMIAKILRDQGKAVAMIGSLGSTIRDQEWPNTLKMTMPGRFYLQQFLYRAKKAGCEYVVVEVTSEGIAQHRLNGIHIDCAVFTNLHKEHIESHGSFENYKQAKLELFRRTRNVHVINVENTYSDEFLAVPARQTVTYGLERGDISQQTIELKLRIVGEFNIYNGLGAMGVAHVYGMDFAKAKASIESILVVSGRMEYVEAGQPFGVVIDYAHTPESLEYAYQTLKPKHGKLICVLGACGGGRDAWKRPVFGQIADRYCDVIFLTNEDPYDEDPAKIISDINVPRANIVIDRAEAIKQAIALAKEGDTVVITGKGSETLMALAGGKKIPWSDRGVALEALNMRN
jgi:UDP-N-acetylmuramoyl-L-alanyl-D-glutamate--2,6-diaminopimelate ligase